MRRSNRSERGKVTKPVWLMAPAAFTVGCGMRVLDLPR
jgi:hypothetical protein